LSKQRISKLCSGKSEAFNVKLLEIKSGHKERSRHHINTSYQYIFINTQFVSISYVEGLINSRFNKTTQFQLLLHDADAKNVI